MLFLGYYNFILEIILSLVLKLDNLRIRMFQENNPDFVLRPLQSNSAALSTEFSFRWVIQETTSPKVRLIRNVYVFVSVLWFIIWNTPWAPLNLRKVAMLTLCQREWHKWDRESDTESPENQTIESLLVDQFTGREKVKTERSLAL